MVALVTDSDAQASWLPLLIVGHERSLCLQLDKHATKPAQKHAHSCCHYCMTFTFVINITSSSIFSFILVAGMVHMT